jgi:glycosyltransferase involved in cell wall biosynthesis
MPRFQLISIVVPLYNEAPTLEELFLRINAVFNPDQPFEVIFIDDGSTDGSAEILAHLRGKFPNITILSHYRNHGKSLALMQGFDAARGEVLVTMDADLQDQPESIPVLLNKISEGYDFVNGWRVDRRDNRAKILASNLFNFLTGKLFRCPLHDINCGFKAMRLQVYKRLNLRGDLHRLMPVIVSGLGFKITEVPVPHEARKFGKSKYRLLRFHGLLDIVSLMAMSTTQLRPFHVFSEMGIMFFLLGLFALGVWFIISLYPHMSSVASLFLNLLWLFGALLIFLGTILPILGFQLEAVSGILQDEKWRQRLLKNKIIGDL